MDAQTLAAWVQAAGSILAIAAAFLISHLHYRSALKTLTMQRHDANVSRLNVLLALAEQTRVLIEKANAGIQGDFASYDLREFDSNDLRGLHEAFATVTLFELPTSNTVFAILRLKEVSQQMPLLMQQAYDDLSQYGGVSPLLRIDSEDLRQATNWSCFRLREECLAAEQLLR